MKKKVLLLGAALSMLLAVSAGAAEGDIVVDPTKAPSYTVTYETATEEQVVLLVLEQGTDLSSGLSVDSILYIDQVGAVDGVAEFKNFQMKTNTSADIYIGTASGAPVSKKDAIQVTAGDVTGTVTLQGRKDHSGATVTLTDTGTDAVQTTTSNSDGTYTFDTVAPSVDYTLMITMPGYLSYTKKTLTVPGAAPEVMLLGGDIDQDTVVGIKDLTQLLARYNDNTRDVVDLNADGRVTIKDLSMLLANYRKASVKED